MPVFLTVVFESLILCLVVALQEELRELGVTALGHRMSLVKGIDALRQAK